MAVVEKDVLRVGTYTLRDGSQHTFTAQDVRSAVANGRKMLRRGEPCPVIWEHDAEAVPMPIHSLLSALASPRDWAADFTRHCFGYAKDFKLKMEKGLPVAYMVNEIPKADDAERWKAARYCSPRIDRNYCDGSGRVYPGASITHLAATAKPVQTNQAPVMLSATPTRKVPYRGTQTIFLSQEIPVADTKDDDKGGAGGGSGCEARVKNALAQLGFTLPDTATNWESIAISLEALAANGAGGGDDLGDEDEFNPDDESGDTTAGNSPGQGTTTAAAPPMMMSGLNGQLETAAKGIVAGYRKQLVARVEKLCKGGMACGVIDGPQARELARRAGGSELSLTQAGDINRTELVAEIETLERCVANALKGRRTGGRRTGGGRQIDLSKLGIVTVPQPNGLSDTANAEAIEAARKAAELRISGRAPETIAK